MSKGIYHISITQEEFNLLIDSLKCYRDECNKATGINQHNYPDAASNSKQIAKKVRTLLSKLQNYEK